MGVPKFYRWISERYPCLSEVVKEYQIPEFDNLYLDMNGVVHVCSHPEDDNPHFRITEEQIFKDIFHYIEVLFRMIKPKKVFFMAIDGVAPRAKMNQQRGRRFRSAREAEDLVRKALEKGEILPQQERFDSNCITPGTPFMVRLHEQLQYFVTEKVTKDPLWQGPKIYLSGHCTPGEGEHKVMDFIRQSKSQPEYDPNTTHCLYGLDADLMMLGLATHEPHFSLLREEVRFGGKNSQKRSTTVEETTFHLLHLSLFREYLDFEFSTLKDKLPFGYNIENIIDDWVLMGFLVGNDFVPHLPNMHIHSDCLPILWECYKKVMPTQDGYLNENGTLHLRRFEAFMKELSKYDIECFQEQYADLKYMEGKLGGKHINPEAARAAKLDKGKSAIESEDVGIPTANEFMTLNKVGEADLSALASMDFGEDDDDDEEGIEFGHIDMGTDDLAESDLFKREFRMFKDGYYMEKMGYPRITKDVLKELTEGYVRAMQWILAYYFNGCQSWGWFYHNHYAPFLSDIVEFADMGVNFDLGTPFLPFQQLMAVLPAASKNLLPIPLQYLMLSENSPVKDYYPTEFETDLNGKQQEWEAVVCIPFINEKRLIEAMAPINEKLTDEEKVRNSHGPHLMFEYTSENLGIYVNLLTEGSFPDIVNHHAQMTELHKDIFRIPPAQIKRGLCDGVKLDTYYPGFPTLKHIPHKAYLSRESVKVFQQNSRGENMMLEITTDPGEKDVNEVSQEYLGQSVYVGWPHLIEGLVIGVSNEEIKHYLEKDHHGKGYKTEGKSDYMNHDDVDTWHKKTDGITQRYHDRFGVEVGLTAVLLEVAPMVGRKYVCGHRGNITLEKQWSKHPVHFVYQSSVKDISVKDPSFKQYKTLDELFVKDSEVFMLGQPHYGCMGKVLDIDPKNEGRIRVDFKIYQEPDMTKLVLQQTQSRVTHYYPGYAVAQQLGVSAFLISRITGTVFITRGSKSAPTKNRLQAGLNLKFNKTNMEVPGYSRKNQEDGKWTYSSKLIQALGEYMEKFPEIFEYLGPRCKQDTFYEEEIFKGDGTEKLTELKEFLKTLGCAKVSPVEHGTKLLDDFQVQEIEEEMDAVLSQNKSKKKHIKMQVRPHLLYRPVDAQNTLVPDTSTTYQLYDRVINAREGYSVPLGLRGTVIGICNAAKEQDIMYEVLLDEPFAGGLTLRCSKNRGYKLPACALINLTHGDRKQHEKLHGEKKPMAVVKPQKPGNQQYGNQGGNRGQQGSYANATRWDNRNQGYGNQGYHGNYQQHGYQQQQQYGGHDNRQLYGGQQQQRPHGHTQQGYGSQGQGRGQPQGQGRGQAASNFEDVWNQLHQGGSKPDTWSQKSQNKPAQQKAGASSLQQAAQVLDTANVTQGQTQGQGSTEGQGMQKISVNQLFKSTGQKQTLDESSVGPQAAESAGDEFANLMMSLNMNTEVKSQGQTKGKADTNVKEGTAALQEMLKIGGTPQKQDEQKHLTVQELFKAGGAAISQQPQPHPSAQQPGMNNLNKPKQRNQKPRRNPVHELHNYCTSMGLPAPYYDYQPGRDNKVCAHVKFGTSVYKGSYAKDRNQAAESAAGVALLNLNIAVGGPTMNIPPPSSGKSQQGGQNPNFSSSPNSAFTPVMGKGGPFAQYPVPGTNMRGPPPPQPGQPFPQAPFMGPQQGLPYQQQGYSPYKQQGGYNTQQHGKKGGYGNQQGGYGNQPGNYGNPQGNYGNQPGNFNWQQQQSGFFSSPQQQQQQHGGNKGYHGNQQKHGNKGQASQDNTPSKTRSDSDVTDPPVPGAVPSTPETPTGEEKTPRKDNPFVPLQAMRMMTPQRETPDKATPGVDSPSASNVEVKNTPSAQKKLFDDSNTQAGKPSEKPRKISAKSGKSPEKDNSVTSKKSENVSDNKSKASTGASPSDKPKSKPPPRKSRLAANFGNKS